MVNFRRDSVPDIEERPQREAMCFHFRSEIVLPREAVPAKHGNENHLKHISNLSFAPPRRGYDLAGKERGVNPLGAQLWRSFPNPFRT